MNVRQPNRSLGVRVTGSSGDRQTRVQRAEIEATVDAIGECREVSSSVLLEVERMLTAGKAGFELAEHGFDPLELGHVFRFAPGRNSGLMGATGFSEGAETGQPIGEHRTSRCTVNLDPPVLAFLLFIMFLAS